MALILEVLDARTGEVRDWHRLGTKPLAIGRGYDNDIILDDPTSTRRTRESASTGRGSR